MFVLIAPLSWRLLFPDGLAAAADGWLLLFYAALGTGLVLLLTVVAPRLTDMGPTFLTSRDNLPVCVALFLVGGWGLGRDVQMEASLTRERASSGIR